MKHVLIWSLAIAAAILIGFSLAQAQIVWQEDFNVPTKDWICCKADCALTPGVPPGYTEFHSNTMCGGDGCNAGIISAADRQGSGRGFRIDFTPTCFPTGENVLKKALPQKLQRFFLRWYERDTLNRFDNFHKLFRLKQASGQILIPEWQRNGSHIQMNLWDAASNSNHFFTGYNLDTDYVPGTWTCYEIFIDIPNKAAEFWVNGESKGKLTNQAWSTSWAVQNIEIGGNQYGGGAGNYRDYDDIVASLSYVGPDGTVPPPPQCVPLPKETQTLACPDGFTGAIIQEQISTCPGPTWGPWTVTSNSCTAIPSCVPEPKNVRKIACPAGQVGEIIEEQVSSCPGPTWGTWTAVSNNCAIPEPENCLKPTNCKDPAAIWFPPNK